MNKKIKGLMVILIGLIFAINALNTTGAKIENSENEWIYVEDTPQKTSISLREKSIIQPILANTQVTNEPLDDRQPSVDLDYAGNPFLLYQIEEDFATSTIAMRRSPDGGETWPQDQVYTWELTEIGAIDAELSFMEDGIRAFATHEIIAQDPIAYLHDYVNIDDPSTWVMYTFDFSASSTYCAETSLTTNGTSIIALASIVDYSGGGYDLQDTIKINWNTQGGEDTWPGVFWINEDSEGRSEPRSHVCADSGEKIFFAYQEDGPSINSRIMCSYCKVDETTEYTDWDTSNVALSSNYNCSYPDISVSGKTAYIAYMCDKDGSQDIYVAKSTSGRFWTRTQVTSSSSDEMYPVISASGDKITVMFIQNGNLYKMSSDDGASTWSTPEQVNEVDGTIDESFRSMDIHSASVGFWTDDRNGNFDIFTDNVADAPIIRIDEINGGFGVSATVSNVGTASAVDIPWSLTLDGLVFLGASASDTITIEPGETETITAGLVFGFGNVDINVMVGEATNDASGFCLGPFVLNVS